MIGNCLCGTLHLSLELRTSSWRVERRSGHDYLHLSLELRTSSWRVEGGLGTTISILVLNSEPPLGGLKGVWAQDYLHLCLLHVASTV